MSKEYHSFDEAWQKVREEDVRKRLVKRSLAPRTDNQAVYLEAIKTNTVTLCLGPAGTGKTYIPCVWGLDQLRNGTFDKIILTRPLVGCVGAGQGTGFLPGDLYEKVTPYMRPMLDVLRTMGGSEIDKFFREGKLEMVPLDLMQGMSVPRCLMIADEMQNATLEQHRMLLTRFGESSKVVVSGDIHQSALKHHAENPLLGTIRRLRNIPHIGVCFLTSKDIVRHPLIQKIDEAFQDHEDGPDEVVLPGQVWYALTCPDCGSRCWYEEEVCEAVCWLCERCWETPEYSDEEPTPVESPGRDAFYTRISPGQ